MTGGATARRKLAFDFGVDPNTSFPPLDDELTRLATANAIGETTTNAGLAFVTGGAGIAISVGGTSSTLRRRCATRRRRSSRKRAANCSPRWAFRAAATDAFYGNPNLSPTDKAIIVAALMNLGGTGGREIFIAGAANAQSIEMGFFYRRQAELIAAFDKKVAPVSAFVRLGGAPMLQTGKGTVSVLPVDYLFWRPPLEGLVARRRARRPDVDHRPGKRAGDVAARRAWLDGGAQGRRQARRVSRQALRQKTNARSRGASCRAPPRVTPRAGPLGAPATPRAAP